MNIGLSLLLAAGTPETAFSIDQGGPRLVGRVLGAAGRALLVPYDAALAPAFAPLAHGRRIILYDMRGRGRSAAVDDPALLGVDHDVADLERVRRHLGLDRVSLVGLSYLGAVVGLYAAEHPQHVERVVMLGPVAPTAAMAMAGLRVQPQADLLQQLQARREAGEEERDPRGFCEAWWDVHLPLHAGGDEVAPAVRAAIAGTCALANEQPRRLLSTLGRVFARFRGWDWSAEARRIQAPLLVLHGDHDKIAPLAGGRAWAAAAADARLLSVGGAGHAAPWEQPEVVFGAIATFLGGAWPEGATAER